MRSGFFNSEITGYDAENMPIFDRAEEASFFAKYFSQFVGNGVFPNPSTNLQVAADEDMTIKVNAGTCFINGYFGWAENDESITLDESDSQARIDRIVAGLDLDDRTITLYAKKGTASGNPEAPAVQRDTGVYEIALADILIPASATEIIGSNITDQRLNSDICGICAGIIQQVDTTTIFNQYSAWFTETTTQAESDIAAAVGGFEDYVEDFEGDMSSWKETQQEDFEAWVETLQDILDEQTAGHLQNEIDAINNNKVTSISSASTDTQYPSAKCVYDAIEEVREIAVKSLDFKGQVNTYADLPSTGQEEGDLYQVLTADSQHNINAGDFVVWEITNNVGAWLNLGSFVDLSSVEDVAMSVTLDDSDWTLNASNVYEQTISLTGITTDYFIDFGMDFDNAEIIGECYVESFNGSWKIYAKEQPQSDVTMNVKFCKTRGGSL